MFVSSGVGARVSGAALPNSLEESSKSAATAVGGPFPNTPAVKAAVAGIGFLVVAMSMGLARQFTDTTEPRVSPAVRIESFRMVEQTLPLAPAGAIIVASPLARH